MIRNMREAEPIKLKKKKLERLFRKIGATFQTHNSLADRLVPKGKEWGKSPRSFLKQMYGHLFG